MTPEVDVTKINEASVEQLQEYLRQLEEEEVTPEYLIGIAYAGMVAVSLLGYDVALMAEDAIQSSQKIVDWSRDETTDSVDDSEE